MLSCVNSKRKNSCESYAIFFCIILTYFVVSLYFEFELKSDPFFLLSFSFIHCQSFIRNTLTDEGIELVLTVMEAKELIGPSDAEQFDTFVRIYMIPEETVAQQTKVYNPIIIIPCHLISQKKKQQTNKV